MPKAKRVKSSQVALGGLVVRIADGTVSLSDYPRLLTNQHARVTERLRRKQAITDRDIRHAADALLCGRFLAAPDAGSTAYERVEYCRHVGLCLCCYAIHKRNTAEELVDDFAKNKNMKLLGIVLSPPRPTDQRESERLLTLLRNTGVPALTAAIAKWRRRTDDRSAVGSYVISAHTQYDGKASLYWAHIHIAMHVHHRCPLCGFGGILKYLQSAFEHSIDRQVIVKAENHGVVQYRQYTDEERRRLHKKKTCSYDYARNLYAYVLRVGDETDTPEITAGRDQLHDDAGVTTSYTRSRSQTSTPRSLPHCFNPQALNKRDLIYFPLDEPDYCQINPADFEETKVTQLATARSLVNAIVTTR